MNIRNQNRGVSRLCFTFPLLAGFISAGFARQAWPAQSPQIQENITRAIAEYRNDAELLSILTRACLVLLILISFF
ncbi:MAG: hypothetical protein LBJ21_02055, partial [Acidobacteriota bacterium]|nr:hypothetical protein [Acidobacteriota bacterium]